MKWECNNGARQWVLRNHSNLIVGVVQMDLRTTNVLGYVRPNGRVGGWITVVESADQDFERVKQQVEMRAALEA